MDSESDLRSEEEIKEDLTRQMFRYLEGTLGLDLKRKIASPEIREILSHLAEWYLAQDYHHQWLDQETDCNFIDELKSL